MTFSLSNAGKGLLILVSSVSVLYSAHRLHEDFILDKHSCTPQMKTLKSHIDNLEVILEGQ